MLSIVLSRRDFREYDQMVTLYTKEKGKVEVLAKGIKKINSKNSASLMPFSLLEAEIVPGREIDHLVRAQSVKFFKNIYSDLDKIALAGYLIEILDQALAGPEKDEKIFDLLVGFLEFINSAEKINSLNLATGFILKLWHCLGFGLEDEKFNVWLGGDWKNINELNLLKKDQVEAYEFACKHAEFHFGHRLTRLFIVDANSC